jgi:hypothetical protein
VRGVGHAMGARRGRCTHRFKENIIRRHRMLAWEEPCDRMHRQKMPTKSD